MVLYKINFGKQENIKYTACLVCVQYHELCTCILLPVHGMNYCFRPFSRICAVPQAVLQEIRSFLIPDGVHHTAYQVLINAV